MFDVSKSLYILHPAQLFIKSPSTSIDSPRLIGFIKPGIQADVLIAKATSSSGVLSFEKIYGVLVFISKVKICKFLSKSLNFTFEFSLYLSPSTFLPIFSLNQSRNISPLLKDISVLNIFILISRNILKLKLKNISCISFSSYPAANNPANTAPTEEPAILSISILSSFNALNTPT